MAPLTDMELKTWTIEQKADYFGIPKYYYTQIQQEMMALDANGGFLAVLFEVDWHLQIFYIQKDPYVQNALKIKGYEYWQKVLQIINRYSKSEAAEEIVEVYDPRTLKTEHKIISNKKEEDI